MRKFQFICYSQHTSLRRIFLINCTSENKKEITWFLFCSKNLQQTQMKKKIKEKYVKENSKFLFVFSELTE